jgi:hypothetical protein
MRGNRACAPDRPPPPSMFPFAPHRCQPDALIYARGARALLLRTGFRAPHLPRNISATMQRSLAWFKIRPANSRAKTRHFGNAALPRHRSLAQSGGSGMGGPRPPRVPRSDFAGRGRAEETRLRTLQHAPLSAPHAKHAPLPPRTPVAPCKASSPDLSACSNALPIKPGDPSLHSAQGAVTSYLAANMAGATLAAA